jgi:hypothetical protein
VTSQNESQEQIKEELRNALAYFIERQKLVAQAMTELGLDLNEVAEFKSAAWSSGAKLNRDDSQITMASPESENAYVKKLFQVAKRASERNLSQSGIWRDNENNEWRYFLHGGGCRLTNVKTGEPIDWDCPDVNSYDRYKFLHHLEWQLTSSEQANKLCLSRSSKKGTLKSLINEIAL